MFIHITVGCSHLEESAGFYGARLRDPDVNKVHIVPRGDLPCHEAPVAEPSQQQRGAP